MADRAKQLQACKAAVTKYKSQLEMAATKHEALSLAINMAENIMKAMKLTSDPAERKELKSQCGVIMDMANRIKHATQWQPPPPMAQTDPGYKQVERWAASVAHSVPLDPSSSKSKASSPSLPSAMLADLSLDPTTKTRATSSNSHTLTSTTLRETNDTHEQVDFGATQKPASHANHRLGNQLDTSASPIVVSKAGSVPVSPLTHVQPDTHCLASSGSQPTRVRKLAPPRSTRKLTTKEEILLLKASVVNGFKCPPWDKNPTSSEFALGDNGQPFRDTRELGLSAYQYQFFQDWVPAQKALPPPSLFPDRGGIGPLMGSSRSIDLVQDAATDCSVVASLCAGVARAERGHEQMLSNMVWPFDKNLGKPVISSNGKYVVRLNFNGCWRKVVIDDRLPVSSTHRLLHVIDRHNPGLLWPALLEKAYLKVRGGYDFPGSNSCGDLWTLTGWIPEQIYLQETDTVPSELWQRIYASFVYGDVLVTVGTGKMSTRQERELGLEGQHSYAVLDLKETDHDRLILVKNPWVEGRGWRGPRPAMAPIIDTSSSSEDPKNGTDATGLETVPSIETPHPTTFWIGLEQVIQHFESLYLNWNPGLFRYRQDIHFEWNIEKQHATSSCIESHPQFSFCSKEGGRVWFLLSRHFRDAPSDDTEVSDSFNDGSIRPETHLHSSGEALKGYMCIYICNGNGFRHYIKDTYLESGPYVNTPQSLLKFDTDENETYTIVIDQDELPASPYTFSLSAFSNSNITLEPASQKYPIHRTEPGQWTKHTAGGSTSSSRYFENPQYTLEIREKCSLAIMLTSTNQANPLHVKLALGYGKRLYRLQSRDVLVDSGDHRGGCVFTEIKDLQPGLYTIICSLFEAGVTGNYTLRVDSTSAITMGQIPKDGAGLLSMKLSPACFGSEVNKLAAPLVLRRLAAYTVVARFLKATSPRSHDLGKLARSPLRLSIELGRGPERKFLVASENGEYADSMAVRTESIHLDPTLAAQSDLWLVLDRLSGPGGPVEEWYDVEILTDMPQACSIGVWRAWDA
ncbi:calpain-like protease palB/rim-13 [Pleomassaria siparia CBS 279.74]|uniref:Calpain-like protease palB/rim-13 n=1 Tax=Pleomassaria siparia CBS 279.74 TaxID=1314801 RepID=A0A6G1KMM3_9PLEO|nr:calpain-like protease palB/rim-13 [Pleomassaria siparia CBS 279.74]